MHDGHNVDSAELAKFEAMAQRWWDPAGEFRPLHDLNPLRLDYIEARAGLSGRRVLDVGCGGGLLAEAMASRGADVTGIDMATGPLEVARLHAMESGVGLQYHQASAEQVALESPDAYDLVTCMELLEHVPRPSETLQALGKLVRPGGHVICSTINRHPKAFALAIVGAEYLLRLLPAGTHEYARFIKPSELCRYAREAGLELRELSGVSYDPFSRRASLTSDTSVNYMAHFVRPASRP
jgi:2-polyprenyl-6-hydroxyphenyl methylase/3-demethylubiquinone-9 3-methyltransferase